VPNSGAKGGISFQNDRGVTVSVFDDYQGPINGFSSVLNPLPSSRHLISGHVRLELVPLLKAPQTTGVALVINGDNLTNEHVWLPDGGGNTGDTIPARRGRTLYVGNRDVSRQTIRQTRRRARLTPDPLLPSCIRIAFRLGRFARRLRRATQTSRTPATTLLDGRWRAAC
jgi:hypothetical protein